MRFPRLGYWMIVCLWLPTLVLAQPLNTVEHVDLNRYLGKWYEIASIPQYFQRDCTRDVAAEYRQDGDNIAVTNRCIKADGRSKVAQGQARVVDKTSQAKLEVTFVHLLGWWYALGGDYWVIDLADDYRYAVVGHPSRQYAWVLAATAHLSNADLAAIEKRLKVNGYDTCALLTTIQTGGLSAQQSLCQVVQTQ